MHRLYCTTIGTFISLNTGTISIITSEIFNVKLGSTTCAFEALNNSTATIKTFIVPTSTTYYCAILL